MKRILPKRLPKPQSMNSAEREYMKNLIRYQDAFTSLLRDGLSQVIHSIRHEAAEQLPEEFRTDSVSHFDVNIEKSIEELLESVQNRLYQLFPDKLLRKWSESMVSHVNDISKRNIKAVASAVDVEIEPLLKDNKLTPYFKNVVNENVGLIKSISQKNIPAFKNKLVYAITNDIHNKNFWHQIEKYIDQNTMSVRAHAKLIARDQVNKLNGRVSQYRQQQLGGKKYTWQTSEDERVREDHKKLDGTTQRWDNPPVVDRRTGRRGHPGFDYQCRCNALMQMDDIVE